MMTGSVPGTTQTDILAPAGMMVRLREQVQRSGTRIRRRFWHRKEVCIYELSAGEIARLPHPHRCARDRWEDLRFCESWSFPQLSREEYLADVSKRASSGEHHLYSIVENDVLVHYGWLTSRQRVAPDPPIGLAFVPPADSAVLWDFYTHPRARGRGLYRETLWQCLHDAVGIDGARHVFIYVEATNTASRHVIEKVGFKYAGSLVGERRLLLMRRYAKFVSAPLNVRHIGPNRVAVRQIEVRHSPRSLSTVSENATTYGHE